MTPGHEAIRGPMADYIAIEDRHHVIERLKSGAPETGYAARTRPILEKSCLRRHSPSSGLKVVDLTIFTGVRTVANVDTGDSLLSLVKLSHIHLFGIGLISLCIGLVFRNAVVIAGAALGLAWAAQILICLYQIWFPKRR